MSPIRGEAPERPLATPIFGIGIAPIQPEQLGLMSVRFL